MTTRVSDHLLDSAVDRLQAGEPITNIMAAYPAQSEGLEALLQTVAMLNVVKPMQTPTPEDLITDRNDFLAQVTELQRQPVSPSPIMRLNNWVSERIKRHLAASDRQHKEIGKMNALFIKVALVLVIAVGSVGGTMAAAAESLPNSVIYPLKLTMEQTVLEMRNDPADQSGLHLSFARERTQEMVRLATNGEVPEETLLNRMQTHMRIAYQLAAQTDNQEMVALLARAKEMTQAQNHNLEQAQEGAQEQIQERLEQASGIIHRWQNEAEAGLQNPQLFRYQYGEGGPCSGDDCEPPIGDANQEQNQNQYGPGDPCEGEGCEPPIGDANQKQNQYGPGDPCEGEECEPPQGDSNQEQNQNQYGPGDPCEGEECEPPQEDSNQEQSQNQNSEQNQDQPNTQDQNQEQNGQESNSQQPVDSGDSNDASGSGDSGGSGASAGGGG